MKLSKLHIYWLCIFLVPINIYGDYIEKITGVQPFIINATTIIVYVLLLFLSKKCKIDFKLLGFLVINVVLIMIHFIEFGFSNYEIKHILYVVLLLLVASNSNQEAFDLLKRVVLIITVPMIIDALVQMPRVRAMGYRMFNIRNYTMIDKVYYTLLFPIAIIILLNFIITTRSKYKKYVFIAWSMILAYVLYAAFEAKIGLAAFVFALAVEAFVIKKEYQKHIMRVVLGVAATVFICGIYISVVGIRLPDYLTALITFIQGNYTVVNSVYYETYFTRIEIIRIVISIIVAHPLVGVGFGGYYNYAVSHGLQNYSMGIEDVESSFFAMLAEGGLIYFCTHIVLLWLLFKKIINCYKMRVLTPDTTGIFACIMFLILGNDYMNIFYWVLIGILWGSTKLKADGG